MRKLITYILLFVFVGVNGQVPFMIAKNEVGLPLQIEVNTALGDGDNTFTIPGNSSLIYDCTVDWGDGNSSVVTAWNDADLSHTYTSGGTYTISITGTFEGFYFNDIGDKLKVISIISFGETNYLLDGGDFYGCSNITGSLPSIPSSVTSIGNLAFNGCSGFTGTLTIPSSVTSIGVLAFTDCSGFTGTLTIPSSVTVIGDGVFDGCSGFTGDLTIPSSITYISASSFLGCTGFNGTLTIPSSVTVIDGSAFSSCSGFIRVDCFPLSAPATTTFSMNLGGTARPLHIQSSGTSGYNVSPWTDTGIFSSIIQDL